jgi:hypothetical protein
VTDEKKGDTNKFTVLGEISKSMGQDLVLVGGGAVEFYTNGWYVTGDLDVITLNRKKLDSVLLEMGFEKFSVRGYLRDEIFIDVVGFEFDRRADDIGIKGTDLVIRMISIEDIIVDRLCACVHWDSPGDCEQAEYLLAGYLDKLDRGYLFQRAADEEVIERLERMLETI